MDDLECSTVEQTAHGLKSILVDVKTINDVCQLPVDGLDHLRCVNS